MSIRAFAEAAETSPRRVRRLIRQGRLRTQENQAGEVRIPECELERVLHWKESRALRQSMELAPVSGSYPAVQPSREMGPVSAEVHALAVPLQRHEAAMMRMGFLESELANTHRLLKETATREVELKSRAENAEHDAISATVRAVEAESRAEEMRSQVIESTFRAVELQDEVKRLKEELRTPWWRRAMARLKPAQPETA